MFIPIREEKNIINFRNINETKNTNNLILLEAAHAFDEQYNWARKCAQIIYASIIDGRKRVSVAFKGAKDTAIKGADIKITNNNLLKTSASIDNLTDKRYVKLTINVRKNILSAVKEIAIDEIWEAIVHELGHGNIYWKRYINGQDINDGPDEYEKWISVINDESVNPNDILYLFCYGLYSTYYHEVQAFVSQTYSSTVLNLRKLYGTTMNITKEKFWNALTRTNTYIVYQSNIDTCNYLLSSDGARALLIRKLNNYDLIYSDEQIISKCKDIVEKSHDALKSSYNNAYQYFYKSFK